MAEHIDYPLTVPLDQDKDPRALDASPRLVRAENARVVSGKKGQIRPRNGTEYLGSPSLFTWPSALISSEEQPGVIQEGSLFLLDPEGEWVTDLANRMPRYRVSDTREVFGGDGRANPFSGHVERGIGVASAACALMGGVTFTAYHVAADRFSPIGGEGVLWCAVNVEGRIERLRIADIPAGAAWPHIEAEAIEDEGVIHCMVAWGETNGTSFDVVGRQVSVAESGEITVSAKVTLVTGPVTTPSPYIWSMVELNGLWYVAVAVGSATDLTIIARDPSGSTFGPHTTSGTSAAGNHRQVAMAAVPSADRLHVWVADNSGDDVSLVSVTAGLTNSWFDDVKLSTSTGQLGLAAIEIGTGRSMCLLNRSNSQLSAGSSALVGLGSGTTATIEGVYPTDGAATDVFPFRVASKMWRRLSSVYFLAVCGPSDAQPNNALQVQAVMGQAVIALSTDMSRWDSSDPYDIVDSGLTPEVLYSQGDVPVVGIMPVGVGVESVSAFVDEVVIPVIRRHQLPVEYLNGYAGLGLEEVRLRTDRKRYQQARLDGKRYFACGSLVCYDGVQFYEVGYSHLPWLDGIQISPGTSGNLQLGTYLIGWGWEWTDTAGDTCASAVQTRTISLTQAGQDEIQLMFNQVPIPLSLKGFQQNSRPVQLVTYLSEPNGTTLYRNISHPLPTGTFGVFTISIQDVFPTAEVCPYTDAGRGELQPFPPPPCTVICAHQGRLYVVPDNDPVRIWYSKPQQSGRALEFSPELTIYVGEPVTSLASSGGNLVVFTENDTYALSVAPADERGVGAGPNDPLLVTAGRGCTDHRATISTPVGVLYRGTDGVMLLPRGGIDPVAIHAIQRTLQQYPDVVSVVHVPLQDAVAFALLDDGEASDAEGVVGVFDYSVGQWFTWRYPSAVHTLGLIGEKLMMGRADFSGRPVIVEADSGEDWDGSDVTVRLETDDIRVGGAAGLARVARAVLVGERLGDSTLSVQESLDSGQTWSTDQSWELDDASEVEVYRRRTLVKQKGTRVRLRVTTWGHDGDRGCAVNAAKLEVTPIKGAVRLPAARRG